MLYPLANETEMAVMLGFVATEPEPEPEPEPGLTEVSGSHGALVVIHAARRWSALCPRRLGARVAVVGGAGRVMTPTGAWQAERGEFEEIFKLYDKDKNGK